MDLVRAPWKEQRWFGASGLVVLQGVREQASGILMSLTNLIVKQESYPRAQLFSSPHITFPLNLLSERRSGLAVESEVHKDMRRAGRNTRKCGNGCEMGETREVRFQSQYRPNLRVGIARNGSSAADHVP